MAQHSYPSFALAKMPCLAKRVSSHSQAGTSPVEDDRSTMPQIWEQMYLSSV